MKSFWNPSVVVTIIFIFITIAYSAPVYIDDYDEENLDMLHFLLAAENKQPPIYPDGTFPNDDIVSYDDSKDVHDDSYASSPSFFDYPPSDETNNDDDYQPTTRHAFKHWPTWKRMAPPSPTTSVNKRTRSCIMKCIKEGGLHPVQCHSLC